MTEPSPPASAPVRWLVLLVLLAGASLFWFVRTSWAPYWDSSIYILTAKSLAAGDGYTLIGENHTLRPPGFPAMLAAIIATCGTNFFAMNLFVSLCGLAALVGLFLYASPRIGPLVSFAVCTLVWLNPCYRRLTNLVMSDLPGLAALFGCLLLERSVRASTSRLTLRIVLLGLAIAATAHIRSVFTLILPAVALSWLLRPFADRAGRRTRLLRVALLGGVVVVGMTPWQVWKALHPQPVPANTAGVYSLMTGLLHKDSGDPRSPRLTTEQLLERAGKRATQCPTALGSRLQREKHDGIAFGLGVLAMVALLIHFARVRSAATAFAILNLLALHAFNDWSYRLTTPVFVLALVTVLDVAIGARYRSGSLPRWVPFATAAGLAALAIIDGDFRGEDKAIRQRHESNLAMKAWVEKNLPPGTPLVACMGHTIAHYFDQPVHFAEVRVRREGAHGLMDFVRAQGIEYFIHTGKQNERFQFELAGALHGGEVVKQHDDIAIIKLGPRPPTLVEPPTNLQAVVYNAVRGDTILAKPGAYPGPINFYGRNVKLIALEGPLVTRIVAKDGEPAVIFECNEGTDTELRGFTLTGQTEQEAGGVICRGTSPTIAQNVFVACRGTLAGGIALMGKGAPILQGNWFATNTKGGRIDGVFVDAHMVPQLTEPTGKPESYNYTPPPMPERPTK